MPVRRLKAMTVEPIGTHGVTLCIFDTHLRQNDTICLILHKRIFPKVPLRAFPFPFHTPFLTSIFTSVQSNNHNTTEERR